MDCLFCKIINGEIPSDKIYEDDRVYAFSDISPTAPVHILIIPKKHIATLNDITEEDNDIIGHIFNVAKEIAKEKGIAENGAILVGEIEFYSTTAYEYQGTTWEHDGLLLYYIPSFD